MQFDMTQGNPLHVIIKFTLPIFIGNMFQQLYNMADTIVVGQFVGTNALAAVGSTGTIMFLIFGLVSGMTLGFTVLTSQRFGANDYHGMRKSVYSATVLSVVISAVMTFVCVISMKPLLTLMQTPIETFDYAYDYIIIICYGIFAQVLYNFLSCVLRAIGDSKTPLFFLILSALLNIGLDVVLVAVLKMGTAGAAYATIISQAVSGILCLIYIGFKVPLLHLHKEDMVFDKEYGYRQLKVGVPMALQYSITAIGTTMVQTSLNMLGPTAMAAYAAACKVDQLVTQGFVALGTTIATYSAQNIGAYKVDRVRQGFRYSTIIGLVYSLIIGIFLITVGKYLTYLFVSTDAKLLLDDVQTYLVCITLFFGPLTVVNVYRNGIQGLGFGMMPMMAGVAELIGRALVSLIGTYYSSYLIICTAGPLAWVFAAALLLVMYFKIMKNYERGIFD